MTALAAVAGALAAAWAASWWVPRVAAWLAAPRRRPLDGPLAASTSRPRVPVSPAEARQRRKAIR